MALIAGIIFTAVWIAAVVICDRGAVSHADLPTGSVSLDRPGNRRFLIKPFRFLLDRSGIWDKLQPFVAGLHAKLIVLNGTGWTIESTKLFVSFWIGSGCMAVMSGAWLSVISGERTILFIGVLLGVVLPAARWRDTEGKVERRKQDILLSLPDVLSKLMLLLGAGETVQRALIRCADRKDPSQSGPLMGELRRANEAIRNGESFASAMEAFSRRCAVQEVSLFTTTLLLNYRRGGERLVLSLKELSYSLWEKRKSVARSRGEEASSKLVFPLVGVFLILMILVASPAILLMRG